MAAPNYEISKTANEPNQGEECIRMNQRPLTASECSTWWHLNSVILYTCLPNNHLLLRNTINLVTLRCLSYSEPHQFSSHCLLMYCRPPRHCCWRKDIHCADLSLNIGMSLPFLSSQSFIPSDYPSFTHCHKQACQHFLILIVNTVSLILCVP
jgi:hypothetical protein